jgi:hypothetical protein
MGMINIEVLDSTGNKQQLVEVPDDVAVENIIAALIDQLHLPVNSPDGALMSYKFHHKVSGRQLFDEETLAEGNVREGDIVRIIPEITAGKISCLL